MLSRKRNPMINLENHPYFTPFKDEKSGVISYVLTKNIAPLQKHFYFTNPSITNDGKYLWFLCANPPARYFTLGVISLDAENPFVRHFPYASPWGSSSGITPEGDGIYYAEGNTVYKLDVEGKLTVVLTVGKDILKGRRLVNLFTHASVSCDNRYLAMDMHIADHTYMSIADLKSGEIRLLCKLASGGYDHAQFSPTKPDLILLDQDASWDLHTGEYFPINNRMWLINTDATRFEPVLPSMFYGRDGTEMAHDYWSADGWVCGSDYLNGAFECNIDTKEFNLVWKRPICHSHTSCNRQMFVGDQTPYSWNEIPCQLLFYDRETNKEIPIFSAMPTPRYPRGGYHHDPHPQFCVNDTMIVSTTTVRDGNVDVALTPVAPLLEACRERGEVVIPQTGKPRKGSTWRTEIKNF